MKKLVAIGAVLFLFALQGFAAPPYYVAHYENVLGTSMELKLGAGSRLASAAAEKAVLAEIARLSGILSAYDPNSEFSRWFKTNGKAVIISPELFEVLTLFDAWRVRTAGALDPSAESVTRIWKHAAKTNRLPDPGELAAAVESIRQPHWRLDPPAHAATHLDRVPLMLNSFAKSYIIAHAVAAARNIGGVTSVILNIGGDIVVSGAVAEPVAISDPKADAENDLPIDQILVHDKAIATSGNYRRGELIAGQWYSHIVDPRTGQPADGIISATVIAPSATDAGALATAFNVLSPNECIRLAAGFPGADYLVITKDGRRIESPGWRSLETGRERTSAAPHLSAAGQSAATFELLINFEINTQKEGSVKRPYIAIWVEDQDHAPVRTITVWHGADRYLPELRSWWLKYRGLYSDDKNFYGSVTSATRGAGKYTIKWDGKDDKGYAVKPGKYVLKIEVSREHGTYQLMRQEFDWNEQPQTFNLTGNTEISSASIDYRKTANGN